MSEFAIETILRRCLILLNKTSGTHKIKNEYHYWIEWLSIELNHVNNKTQNYNTIVNLINKNKFLKKDIFSLNKKLFSKFN